MLVVTYFVPMLELEQNGMLLKDSWSNLYHLLYDFIDYFLISLLRLQFYDFASDVQPRRLSF